MPHLTHKEDVNISLILDSTFTGVLRGIAHDESEGCTVKGNCIVQVNKPIKVRRLLVWLEGRMKVTIKTGGYSVSGGDGVESRTIFTKDQHFIGQDGQMHILTPGQYVYPFQFDLPPQVPASFRGKRGYVRYRLQAGLYRPMFASDQVVSKDIPIRRCLLNEARPIDFRETYEGRHPKLIYTANVPTMTYREGGLIRLNLTMALVRPETQSIRTVTCALRERVQYRTTDGNAHTVSSKTDTTFPLGYSTFYPNQAPDYDPKEKADYNALFRLCPRVNADLTSRLMKVTHALVVNIMVEDTDDRQESCDETDNYLTESEWETEERDSKSTAGDSPILRRSSSASSLASIFSLGRHEIKTKGPRLTICSIEVPLVVTSREHVWDQKPEPPSYNQLEEPPSYHSSLEYLPRAPLYEGAPV